MMMLSVFFSSALLAVDVDTKASNFKWTGTKVTGKHFGKIMLKEAKLQEAEGKLTGGEFVMDLNTVTADDLEGEWKQKLEGHLKNEDFFNVAKYPTAKLVISKITGDKVEGTMTVKDKTNPVSFTFKKDAGKYTGTLKFDRTKFGMVYGSGNFFKDLGDKMIHDEVTLDFTVVTK
jgi:polyisoprenoid-binding protein YceI